MNDEDIVQPLEPVPVEEPASNEGEPVKGMEVIEPIAHEDEVPDSSVAR